MNQPPRARPARLPMSMRKVVLSHANEAVANEAVANEGGGGGGDDSLDDELSTRGRRSG
jgi:hypothetical protein